MSKKITPLLLLGTVLSLMPGASSAAIVENSRSLLPDFSRSENYIAQDFNPYCFEDVAFSNDDWEVFLWYWPYTDSSDGIGYYGRNKRTGDVIELTYAEISGTPERRIFTWYNGNYTYQVAWRPSDPTVIRLQVFDPNSREILNQLLYNPRFTCS